MMFLFGKKWFYISNLVLCEHFQKEYEVVHIPKFFFWILSYKFLFKILLKQIPLSKCEQVTPVFLIDIETWPRYDDK